MVTMPFTGTSGIVAAASAAWDLPTCAPRLKTTTKQIQPMNLLNFIPVPTSLRFHKYPAQQKNDQPSTGHSP
jgi:hypothetical protein